MRHICLLKNAKRFSNKRQTIKKSRTQHAVVPGFLYQYVRVTGYISRCQASAVSISCLTLQIPNYQIFTTPEKPMKAMANRPAVMRAIGVPCMPLGMLTRLICSRKPAKRVKARPKPKAVEKA